MATIDYSRALVPVPGQERIVRRRFWEKVKKTLGKVPFLDQALAAYYAASDPATPRAAKAVLMAALAYFIVPADLLPDVLAGIGFTDDATVLMLAIQSLAPHIKDDHVKAARRFLRGSDQSVAG
jgi:uncharacterized membrane protein YkvA (DUF1232 family)